MCTIAVAKVQLNYNCYNVYFYECLQYFYLMTHLRPSLVIQYHQDLKKTKRTPEPRAQCASTRYGVL